MTYEEALEEFRQKVYHDGLTGLVDALIRSELAAERDLGWAIDIAIDDMLKEHR